MQPDSGLIVTWFFPRYSLVLRQPWATLGNGFAPSGMRILRNSMPDHRTHRGPHPEDVEAFTPAHLGKMESATADFSWLLTRGYAQPSGIKLVGDRYQLTERQRLAVLRCASSDLNLERRREREVYSLNVVGSLLLIDGFNVITTVEAALAGGVVLQGRDSCFRDMASVHGHFKLVSETEPAVELIGQILAHLQPAEVVWYLDRPVSNSGRLAEVIRNLAERQEWNWKVELVQNPDAILSQSEEIVATADSAILDKCKSWFNLARTVVQEHVPAAWVVRLDSSP